MKSCGWMVKRKSKAGKNILEHCWRMSLKLSHGRLKLLVSKELGPEPCFSKKRYLTQLLSSSETMLQLSRKKHLNRAQRTLYLRVAIMISDYLNLLLTPLIVESGTNRQPISLISSRYPIVPQPKGGFTDMKKE